MSQNNIRNFSIIAHIDHGKTTLTDRFLNLTNAINERDFTERVMDSNPIEQERGITIKLAPVRMEYEYEAPNLEFKNSRFILNLIDTPGHVDFSYEVSRSLAACEGALLLVDSTQGIQAQTLSHFEKAKELNLKIIPVLNKVDLPASDLESVSLECMEAFGVSESEIISVSAKTGFNADKVLDAVIERVPAPDGKKDKPLRALVFTSYYDIHLGIVASVRVVDGQLNANSKLYLPSSQTQVNPVEIGVFSPSMKKVNSLKTGEVGYVATGLKSANLVRVGDTVMEFEKKNSVSVLPGYQEPTPMVFMEFYPIDGDDFAKLTDGMEKLSLHDSSLFFKATHSSALGNGYQVGFLGLLHAEIVKERLSREFSLELIATAPSVSYEIVNTQGKTITIASASQFPDPSIISQIKEPIAHAIIFTPEKYLGAIMQLCQDHRGKILATEKVGSRLKLSYDIPLSEIITSFYDSLKSVSSGFASLDYTVKEYRAVDAVKLNILVNKELVEALSMVVVKDKAEMLGRKMVKKLKEVIPRQMFEIPVQAAIGGKVVARETIKAYRKDVTAKLYGGDVTRRKKLLAKQAKGKKKMKQMGSVQLDSDTFLAVLKQ
ncbi:MAG: translation elongation factor 4 [Patescibacteria group bacterium]